MPKLESLKKNDHFKLVLKEKNYIQIFFQFMQKKILSNQKRRIEYKFSHEKKNGNSGKKKQN